MPLHQDEIRRRFERGVAIISIDTEQIWGYSDLLSDAQYHRRFPGALLAHDTLLARLRAAQIGATWFVVGGMALDGSSGPLDPRMGGLPASWKARFPAGSEAQMPLWYRASFVQRLRRASPMQEIGLHGGLTHFIWTDSRATRKVVESELVEGVRALRRAHIHPSCFSFGRNQEAHHDLLPAHGLHAYRGGSPVLSSQLGPTLPGAALRALDELVRATPPPVWPRETLPGLWNIPSSVFLYPIGPARARVVPLRSRIARFGRGLEAAARSRGIFHFSFHPENLAESPEGFAILDEILERLIAMRDWGDIEVLTMGGVAARLDDSLDPVRFLPRRRPPARRPILLTLKEQ